MSELTTALAIVLSINALFFLMQVSVLNLNPQANLAYNCDGDILSLVDAQACMENSLYVMNDTNPASILPSQGGDIETDSGVVYTDTSSASSTWLSSGHGLNTFQTLVYAPKNILVAIGMPGPFAFAIGALWYLFTGFLIVAFVLGRS